VKNAIVPLPDGSHRLLHCMESPEHCFEDFGSAKLKNGRAIVKLDANFAKVIKRRDYRVFVTPEGDWPPHDYNISPWVVPQFEILGL
jgi:hypothetical protein